MIAASLSRADYSPPARSGGERASLKVLYVGRFDIPNLMARVRNGEAPSNHVHALPDLERFGYEVRSFKPTEAELGNSLRFQQRVLRELDGIDVIVGHAHHDLRWIAALRRFGRIRQPVCAFVHSHKVRFWHRLYLSGFDVLWPISHLGEQRVLDNGAPPENVRYFPYGPDLRYYDRPLPKADGQPIVLSVGVSQRDFATLIDAARSIRGPVHIVGRVGPEDAARAPDNVTLHSSGNYDLSFADLLELYRRARCVAVTHHGTEHPFGCTAVAEAMAHGRAVVCTASAGLELDPAKHGSGLTVPAHDPQAVATAVNSLFADEALAEKMGARGRQVTETQANCEIDARIMAESIETALQRRAVARAQ